MRDERRGEKDKEAKGKSEDWFYDKEEMNLNISIYHFKFEVDF